MLGRRSARLELQRGDPLRQPLDRGLQRTNLLRVHEGGDKRENRQSDRAKHEEQD